MESVGPLIGFISFGVVFVVFGKCVLDVFLSLILSCPLSLLPSLSLPPALSRSPALYASFSLIFVCVVVWMCVMGVRLWNSGIDDLSVYFEAR